MYERVILSYSFKPNEGTAMSDPVQMFLIGAVLVLLLASLVIYTFKDAFRERLRLGSSFDARAELQAFKTHFSLGGLSTPQLSEKGQQEVKEIKEELVDKPQQWKKTKAGNIYWLGSDLTLAIPISREGSPDDVKHYVSHTFWHASELALGEPIVGRFARLCEKTKSFTQQDWNSPSRREEVAGELWALLHAIAFVMEAEDEFRKIPDDWNKC
jgi:hypothetical protein